MSNWTLLEKSTGELRITIDGQAWKDGQEKAFNKIANSVSLPGFRKGKVPTHILKQRISTNEVMQSALDMMINDLYVAALKEHDLMPIAQPTLSIESIDTEAAVLVCTVVIMPEVSLGDYKNIKMVVSDSDVTEEEVSAEIKKACAKYSELVTKEGAVALSDTAVIDFDGYLNGEKFDGGYGENHSLKIGSNSFVPGFEEQLIGCVAGEEKDVNITFPEDYYPELAGKDVVFKVTVKEVQSEVFPELDDEFVKDLNIDGVETVSAYEEMIKNDLTVAKKNANKKEAEDNYFEALFDVCPVEIPDVMVEDEKNRALQEFAYNFNERGGEAGFKQFLQSIGMSAEQLKETLGANAEQKVRYALVLRAIGKAENIEVSDDDVVAAFNDERMTFDVISKTYNVSAIKNELIVNKVSTYLLNNATE